tara:strand:- start:1844 stop:3058 length:1215 start_codon:yes stop_codon:yes gene_type:complete
MRASERRVRAHRRHLEHCLGCDQVDLAVLRRLAIVDGGYLDVSLRRRVWPLLLGIDRRRRESVPLDLTAHRDSDQVALDINRSLFHFDAMKEVSTAQLLERQAELSTVINTVLCRRPQLHYYQGFHDVCSVALLVCDDKPLASALSEKLAISYFETCMRKTIDPVADIVRLVPFLVRLRDVELADFIERSGVQPFFAVPWVLTWFSHNFKALGPLYRVWDFLLASHPVMSLYCGAALILLLRDRILSLECEHSAIHSLLQRPPVHELPGGVDALVSLANALFESHPPSSLDLRGTVRSTSLPLVRPDPHGLRFQPSDAALCKDAARSRRRRQAPGGGGGGGGQSRQAPRPQPRCRGVSCSGRRLCWSRGLPEGVRASSPPQRQLRDLIALIGAIYIAVLAYCML